MPKEKMSRKTIKKIMLDYMKDNTQWVIKIKDRKRIPMPTPKDLKKCQNEATNTYKY